MAVDPAFVQTAIEIVLRAGAIQLARQNGDLQVGKKGPIDLVTAVDVEVETMCREMIAERFPDHQVLAEELPNSSSSAAVTDGHRWIFDPIDGTVNYAHGLPIFCSSLALEIEGTVVVGAVYDPSREELFVAERGGGHGSTDRLCRCPRPRGCSTPCFAPGFRTTSTRPLTRWLVCLVPT